MYATKYVASPILVSFTSAIPKAPKKAGRQWRAPHGSGSGQGGPSAPNTWERERPRCLSANDPPLITPAQPSLLVMMPRHGNGQRLLVPWLALQFSSLREYSFRGQHMRHSARIDRSKPDQAGQEMLDRTGRFTSCVGWTGRAPTGYCHGC
jgi:hypothetical protein